MRLSLSGIMISAAVLAAAALSMASAVAAPAYAEDLALPRMPKVKPAGIYQQSALSAPSSYPPALLVVADLP